MFGCFHRFVNHNLLYVCGYVFRIVLDTFSILMYTVYHDTQAVNWDLKRPQELLVFPVLAAGCANLERKGREHSSA